MRKLLLSLAALLMVVLLCACGGAESDRSVSVVIEEGPGFTVDNNPQRVAPGEDAVFLLKLGRDAVLLSADYRGEYEITERDGVTELRLVEPRFPTRVRLQLAAKSGQIRYEANGGAAPDGGTAFTKSVSLSAHRRANTALGADVFSRAGHTLTGWNTLPEGSGQRIGLGSRVSLPEGELVLYAQWAPWTEPTLFAYEIRDGAATLTGYRGVETALVIPAEIDGLPVRRIAAGAFRDCAADTVILPPGLYEIEPGAFSGSSMTELTLFDDLAVFSDASFDDCGDLRTLHINAREAPFGYVYRKESCYADKVDLLILAQGRKKLVFYGGCSAWYNLDGRRIDQALGGAYTVANLGLNGTVSSAVQLQILQAFLEPGDILFHTPELSSRCQLMLETDMGDNDGYLWCGLENNYDLFALVDLRTVGGVFDSFCAYLAQKDSQTNYDQFFSDDYRTPYMDEYGCVPLYRSMPEQTLADIVDIEPALLTEESLQTLGDYYKALRDRGVRVYVSCACLNWDALPEAQRGHISDIGDIFNQAVEATGAAVPVSDLEDYVYHAGDFYDTNYHLLSGPAGENTEKWLRDLTVQMVRDGLWEDMP